MNHNCRRNIKYKQLCLFYLNLTKYKMTFEKIKYNLTINLKNIKIYNKIYFAEINVRIWKIVIKYNI